MMSLMLPATTTPAPLAPQARPAPARSARRARGIRWCSWWSPLLVLPIRLATLSGRAAQTHGIEPVFQRPAFGDHLAMVGRGRRLPAHDALAPFGEHLHRSAPVVAAVVLGAGAFHRHLRPPSLVQRDGDRLLAIDD